MRTVASVAESSVAIPSLYQQQKEAPARRREPRATRRQRTTAGAFQWPHKVEYGPMAGHYALPLPLPFFG